MFMCFIIITFFALQVCTATAADGSTIIVPLLDRIYYDSLRAEIPERYVELDSADTLSFRESELNVNTEIEVYRQILNIIGYRLRENSSWTITLKPLSIEEGASDSLRRARANEVQEYLHRVWSVDISRIHVDMATSNIQRYSVNTEIGNRANWYVQLVPSDVRLLRPVRIVSPDASKSAPLLYAPLLPWNPDNVDVTPQLQVVLDEIVALKPTLTRSEIIVHANASQRQRSHWYVLGSKRADMIKKAITADAITIRWDTSRHDVCSHQTAEECAYLSALYVVFNRTQD